MKRKYKLYKNIETNFMAIGQNISGLNSKIESLLFVVNKLKPSLIMLQETKLKKVGTVNIQGYQIRL